MSRHGWILHTPVVRAYLENDRDVHRLVTAAVREPVTLILPSGVLAAATGPLTGSSYTFEEVKARAESLLRAPIIVADHLIAGDDDNPERAIRAGHLAQALTLNAADAHTAAVATTRWWPIFTTRAAAAPLLKVEPRLAFDYIG
jgi:hypothetical protein